MPKTTEPLQREAPSGQLASSHPGWLPNPAGAYCSIIPFFGPKGFPKSVISYQ
jgi:hypothetical protein